MRITFTCVTMTALLLAGCEGADSPMAGSSAPRPRELASEKLEASLSAAGQYLQTGEIDKAEAIVRTLINRAPDESRGHELLGQTLMQKAIAAEAAGDPAGAADLKTQAYAAYAQAVRCDASTPGLQHSAGLMAMAAGETEAALRHFQTAAALDPTDPQYLLFEAQLLIPLKRFDEAEHALNRVLQVNPDEAYAHASLAMIALERSQFDIALREMTLARQAMPDDAGMRAQHAQVYRRMDQPRQALELLVGLDEAERAQEAVAFEIAAGYDALNEPAKAAAAWMLCFNANPRGPRAVNAAMQAARLHLKAGDIASAARCADRAQSLAPQSKQVEALLKEIRSAG
jgi:tetratricopeptide (TPR) repeat protein